MKEALMEVGRGGDGGVSVRVMLGWGSERRGMVGRRGWLRQGGGVERLRLASACARLSSVESGGIDEMGGWVCEEESVRWRVW